jgi:heptosyltransferase III
VTTGHRSYVAQRKAKFPPFPGAPPPALPCVLKVENTLAVCVLPHCGQGVCTTNCGRKVSRSNVAPHSSQAYSKIGICHSSTGILSLSTVSLLVYSQVERITRVNLEPAMQRMLVIRGGAVGDLIVTLPTLGALRRAFPHATIELLGNPSRAILAQHPRYVDRVIDLERWDLYRLFSQRPTLSQGLTTFLRSFELILSYLPVPDLTFATNLRRYCQGEILTWQPHPPPGVHITDHLLQPVRRFVRQPYDACPHVYLDPAAQAFAAHFWQTPGLPDQGVIAFHPGSGGAHKLWPWTGWEQIMTWTVQQGLQGLMISGPVEQAHNAHLPHPAHFPPWPRAQNLPLPYLAALLARCQVMVGHDSGITHLAAAVGTTTLALFGPTDPLLWGPRSHRACVLQPESAGPLTLTHLPPDSVTQILTSMLRGTFAFTPSQAGCTILRRICLPNLSSLSQSPALPESIVHAPGEGFWQRQM